MKNILSFTIIIYIKKVYNKKRVYNKKKVYNKNLKGFNLIYHQVK